MSICAVLAFHFKLSNNNLIIRTKKMNFQLESNLNQCIGNFFYLFSRLKYNSVNTECNDTQRPLSKI